MKRQKETDIPETVKKKWNISTIAWWIFVIAFITSLLGVIVGIIIYRYAYNIPDTVMEMWLIPNILYIISLIVWGKTWNPPSSGVIYDEQCPEGV